MIVRNTTQTQLELCARAIDVDLSPDMHPMNKSKTAWRVRLTPSQDNPRKYGRISAHYMQRDRRVHAVCWHGYRDFFTELYHLCPTATVITRLGTYKGVADFYEHFEVTGNENIGAPTFPVRMRDACECNE